MNSTYKEKPLKPYFPLRTNLIYSSSIAAFMREVKPQIPNKNVRDWRKLSLGEMILHYFPLANPDTIRKALDIVYP